MSYIPLKYRIALVIFLLEAIMLAFVLTQSLNNQRESNRSQLAARESVILHFITKIAHSAALTGDHSQLQYYLDQVVSDPHVTNVLVTENNNVIVAALNPALIGTRMPPLTDDAAQFWRIEEIRSAAETLGTVAINFSHAELYAANRRALDIGVKISLLGMIIIASVGIAAGHWLTRQLHRLAEAAHRLGDGDFSARTGLAGRDELAMVGQVFDNMAENVSNLVRELKVNEQALRQTRDELESRVAERTRELSAARDQALQATRAKGAFLANVSHELRTPLNAIIGYSEIVREELAERNDLHLVGDIQRISHAGNHLLAIINDILDISKIEAGRMELFIEVIDIPSVVTDVVNTIRPLAAQHESRIDIEIDCALPTMESDEKRIRQILLNLLSNAAKFTEKGVITVTVVPVDQNGQTHIKFSVKDTGIGVSDEYKRRMFTEFTQADTSATRRHGGTGLGLAITRRLTELLQGTIGVESEEGVGSTFTVILPATHHIVTADDSTGTDLPTPPATAKYLT